MFVSLSAFHWHPVRSTKKIASIAARSGTRGLWQPNGCLGRGGSSFSISAHNASGKRQPSSRTRRFVVFSPSFAMPQIWAASISLSTGIGSKPIHAGGDAENAHERACGFLITCCDGPPFFELGPEPLDLIAVGVDPVGTGDRRLIAPGWDHGPGSQVPDVLTKGVAAVASVSNHPFRHARKLVEECHRMRQFVRLSRRQHEGNSAAETVGDHTSFGAIAATRAAKRLTCVPLRRSVLPLAAPAAFWWARMFVPSRNVIPSCTPRSWTSVSRRSHTPSRDQRMKVWAAIHHGPSSFGTARHLAPLSCRHRIALIVRRRCCGGTFACGRQASIKGSSIAHCTSVSIPVALLKGRKMHDAPFSSDANRP